MAETNEPLQQLRAALRQGGPDFAGDPLAVRQEFEALLATMPVSDDLTFSETQLGGVPALYSPTGPTGPEALLYLHGGAFTAGSAKGYRGLAANLGRAAGVQTFSADYRLAPENPFPAALDDAASAYRALLEQQLEPGRIIIAGDSAGGGLALALLVKLRDEGTRLPAAALLISPWADLACTGATFESKREEDPSLTPAGLRAMASCYLAGADPHDRLASPIHADLSGLPPLLIQVGSAEILLDDALRIAGVAGAAGTQVQLEVWPEMIHVWHAFHFMLPEGRQAIEGAGTFLRKQLNQSG